MGLLELLPRVGEYEAEAELNTEYPVGKALVVIGFILMLFVEQILFDGHTHHLPEEQEESENKAPLLERTRTIVVTYRDPLITEAAVLLHSILENITLGLAVRSRS
jgi:zinc transporter ZupT